MRKESLNETSFMYKRTSHYFEDDTPCCSLHIVPGNKMEENYLKNVFSRITTPSPAWKQSIEIDACRSTDVTQNNQDTRHVHEIPKSTNTKASTTMTKTKTQSLSVNFIMREQLVGNEVHSIRRLFLKKPWTFHHTFQTFDMEKQKVIAKQPYYELTEDYPLISPSVCHKGFSVLRYNIFVKDDFVRMREFYAFLLRSQPMYEEENFCYFTIYSKNGAEIQLSLKQSKQLSIISTKRTFLKIQIDNVYESLHEIGSKIEEIFCSECGILVTRDPEGNPILVTGKSRDKPTDMKLQATCSVPRQTSVRKIRRNSSQWSDCSTGCSECMRNIHLSYDHTFYDHSNDRDDISYNDDSGYHNDDMSTSDDYDDHYEGRNTLPSNLRHQNNNNYNESYNAFKNNKYCSICDETSSRPVERSYSTGFYDTKKKLYPNSTNKVLYDSAGGKYTCCVAYV